MKLIEQLVNEELSMLKTLDQQTAYIADRLEVFDFSEPNDDVDDLIGRRAELIEQIVRLENRIKNVEHNGEQHTDASRAAKASAQRIIKHINAVDAKCQKNLAERLEAIAGRMQSNSSTMKMIIAYAGELDDNGEQGNKIDLQQ